MVNTVLYKGIKDALENIAKLKPVKVDRDMITAVFKTQFQAGKLL